MKKKILFILHLPPPIHGASTMGKYIKEGRLINDAFQCDYINLSTSRRLSDIGKSGFTKFFVFIKLYFRVVEAAIKNKYDLYYLTINSKGPSFYKDFVIVFILKLFGRRIVYHYHNKGIAERQDRKFYNLLYRFQFKNSRAILLSPRLYNDVAKYLPKEHVYYCANGISEISDLNNVVIDSKRVSKSIPEVLFLSNMIKEKGVFSLLNACKSLYSKGVEFKMIFVGDWVDIKESEFNKFIKANNLAGKVFCEGKRFEEEKSTYFESADIFIHPTLNDCFPLTILEAMQYGLPVISTNEGGILDMVSDNETGYLVEKKDEKALADKIQYLIENPDVRRRMGSAAKRKFQGHFTIDKFEENFVKTLNAIINQYSFKDSHAKPSVQTRKVLFIYKFLPQYRVDFFQRLKDALLAHNVELQLIYGKSKGRDTLKNDEVDISWAKYIPNKTFGIGNIKLIWQPCLKYLKGKNLVIVQLENKLLINYYLMFLKGSSTYKMGYWGHGRNMQANVGSLRNKFKFLYINKCNWWFAYTEGVKRDVLKHHFPANKITVVQNAIDTLSLQKVYAEIDDTDLNKLKEELGITGSRIGIYCGAMYHEKRIDFMIETCKEVKKAIPDFHMLFVGSGIDSSKVIRASKVNDWIHYIGPKFGNDRIKYFKISSIQMMPGSVGLGILDSFALETPIVTTKYPYHGPEIDYLENGINGIITEDNIEEYSKEIIDLMQTGKYADLIEGCKLSSNKYTVEAMVDNFKNGILSCLESERA